MAACSLFGEKPAQELGVAAVYSRDPKLSSLYRKKLSFVENDGYGAHVNLYGEFYYIPALQQHHI